MILWHFLFSLCCAGFLADATKMKTAYEWKYFDWLWDCDEQKKHAIDSGKYHHENVFLIDVQPTEDFVIVTTPRSLAGVPCSLSTISNQMGPGGPLLRPYPDWSFHNRTDCQGITSVWRVFVDRCNRLWVLDSGHVGDDQVCPAQLLVFSLKSNKLLNRVKIEDRLLRNPRNNQTALLVTPVVETYGRDCSEVWVYMADITGWGVVIWNGRKMWRLDDDVFGADPSAVSFTVADESFEIADGVVGMAVSPRRTNAQQFMYFRPLASRHTFCVPIADLHKSYEKKLRYEKSDYALPSQAAAHEFSRGGVLFFGLSTQTALTCWNMNKPYNEDNVVILYTDRTTLQFTSGVKIRRYFNGRHIEEQVWIATNRFQKIMKGSLDFTDVNFRILWGNVNDLVAGTRCQAH